jgi:SAM-dependent methyltransferase
MTESVRPDLIELVASRAPAENSVSLISSDDISQAQFRSLLDLERRNFHAKSYFEASFYRQYRSSLMVLKHLRKSARILSLGAGGAFVEEFAVKSLGASVYIVDFPETLALEGDLYRSIAAEAFPGDISDPAWVPPVGNLDAVFWFDNVEHLRVDPTLILRRVACAFRPDGQIFITTDNFARFRNIIKLALNRSIVAPPGDLFSSVDFQHEYVHRREYTLPEMEACLMNAGLQLREVEFLWQNRCEPIRKRAFVAMEWLFPRLRPHMLIRAGKA